MHGFQLAQLVKSLWLNKRFGVQSLPTPKNRLVSWSMQE